MKLTDALTLLILKCSDFMFYESYFLSDFRTNTVNLRPTGPSTQNELRGTIFLRVADYSLCSLIRKNESREVRGINLKEC